MRNRKYFEQNRDKILAQKRARLAARSEAQRAEDKAASRRWHAAHREAAINRGRALRRAIKLRVLRHYGPGCACCGELDSRLLSLEHSNGDGAAHRRELFGSTHGGGANIYRKLIDLGLPGDLGLTVLCISCNHASHTNGGRCPHETPDETFLTDQTALGVRIAWLEAQLASARATAVGA